MRNTFIITALFLVATSAHAQRFDERCVSIAEIAEVCKTEKAAYTGSAGMERVETSQSLKACMHGFMDECTALLRDETPASEKTTSPSEKPASPSDAAPAQPPRTFRR
jgi:hypothetical protein